MKTHAIESEPSALLQCQGDLQSEKALGIVLSHSVKLLCVNVIIYMGSKLRVGAESF